MDKKEQPLSVPVFGSDGNVKIRTNIRLNFKFDPDDDKEKEKFRIDICGLGDVFTISGDRLEQEPHDRMFLKQALNRVVNDFVRDHVKLIAESGNG